MLAATYRIFDHLGWTMVIFNHITVRLPGPEHHFLINPFGLRYDEVTASNLVKIDLQGNVVGGGDAAINYAGFVIHGAIHANVPEALWIMHTHTREGIEQQFATNVLGYFWMIEAFIERLKQGSGTRIVNVASYWAGGLDLHDLEFKKRRYNNDAAYRQSKQADRMLTVAFAKRLQPLDITVNACHPGDVNSIAPYSLSKQPIKASTQHKTENVEFNQFLDPTLEFIR